MTEVVKVLKNLANLSESDKDALFKYSIFEADQVLTHNDLNTIASYFNYQTRLTRVNLFGVGIISGLRVSLKNDQVKVTEGIGLTTDGDLLFYATQMSFNRFKVYGNYYSIPLYTPFYVDGDPSKDMIPVYELVRDKIEDNQATELSQFNATTGKFLTDMVAVLYMESYINDPDICSGTDCDNRGQDYLNKLKVLLVEKTFVKALNKKLIDALKAANKNLPPVEANAVSLKQIFVDRPDLFFYPLLLNNLEGIYVATCNDIHQKLIDELPKLSAYALTILVDLVEQFPSDPSGAWITTLNNFNAIFNNSNPTNDPTKYTSFQYYYDFLKDVAQTYNHFVELSFELFFKDATWLCPDIDSFPKHLLLGSLIPDDKLQESRTIFYPSPLLSQSVETINHLKFIFKKIHTLINTFQVSLPINLPIRITPSKFEDQPLEERAIPCYYEVNTTNPIQENWNYRLHQRGMDSYNYSYNANAYGASGGAVQPFHSQIGHFPFFRIEGHLGKNVDNAVNYIKQLLLHETIPFDVQAIRLKSDLDYFRIKHPGMEHFAGVLRGGTFVLLVDENNETVVADFMLPYFQPSLLERVEFLERQVLSPQFSTSLNEFWPPIAQPGVNLKLFGNNFDIGNPTIRFVENKDEGKVEVPATIVEKTKTGIIAKVPNLTRGSDVAITITTKFGQVTSNRKLRIPPDGSLLSPPSFNPKSGSEGAIISLFFEGYNEPRKPTIWFGEKQAEIISLLIPVYGGSATGGGFLAGYSVSVKVPLMKPGQVKIAAINEFGIVFSTNLFTVLPDPYLYGFGNGIGVDLIWPT